MKGELRIIFFTAIFLVLFVIDGNTQPTPITQIPSDSRSFTTIGDLVYFSANNDLYRTDGTAEGTIVLGHVVVRELIPLGDVVIVLADGPRQTKELWRTDGTPEGTFPLAAYYTVTLMGQTDQYLFFAASLDETGRELYRTDGTSQGTILLKDIYPGPENGISDRTLYSPSTGGIRYPAAAVDGELLFAADNGVDGSELWKSDGTSVGTVMVKDINPGAEDGFAPGPAVAFDGNVYFRGVDPVHGPEPWISDGTPTGTRLLKELIPGSEGTVLEFISERDGTLFFASYATVDSGVNFDLWKTDGTAGSTSKVETLCLECRYDSRFLLYGDKLYFLVYQMYGVNQVWGTDGTAEGTERIFSEFLDGSIPFFEEVNDHMIFYTTSQGHNLDLYRSDGHATTPFWTFNSGGLMSNEIDIAKVGDRLFFADHAGPSDTNGNPNDPDDAFQLMQSDGFTVQAVRDMFGTSLQGTSNITNFNDKVLFTTPGGSLQLTLWLYDPEDQVATFTIVNADTDDDIQTLHEGDVFVKPAGMNINIRYNPVGEPGSVVFEHQGRAVRRENEAPFTLAGDHAGDYLTWTGAIAGMHRLEAIPYAGSNATGEAGPSLVVNFTIEEEGTCTAAGMISYEKWNGIQGNEVFRVPVNTEPSQVSTLTAFQAPSNQGINYGARIRGYICPPVTGDYTFWIASNDNSELWLSTDDDPMNKRLIAWLTRATNPEEWNKFSTQRSTTIRLEQGERYYIEALHKQGIGTDHVAVGWQLPDGTMERPIAGTRLSPFTSETSEVSALARMEETSGSNDPFGGINIYPNPATTNDRVLTIGGFEGIDQVVETDVEIIDMAGEVIVADKVSCGGGCDTYPLSITEALTPGLYVIKMKTKNGKLSRRLLVK